MYSDGEDGCIELANAIKDIKDNTKKYEIYNCCYISNIMIK